MNSYEEKFDNFIAPYFEKRPFLALLLDYDGTLTPLVEHPDKALLDSEIREVLGYIAKSPKVFVAVASGRAVDDVRGKIQIDGITYAGSHGQDIQFADGQLYKHPLDPDMVAKIRDLKVKLESDVCPKYEGSWVEDKTELLCFHYRNVAEDCKGPCEEAARSVISSFGLKIGPAHMALECKPPGSSNKGVALKVILEKKFGEEWHKEIGAVFIGDDVTDEDAMQMLKGKGFSFRVTHGKEVDTAADRTLPSVTAVHEFLKWLKKEIEE